MGRGKHKVEREIPRLAIGIAAVALVGIGAGAARVAYLEEVTYPGDDPEQIVEAIGEGRPDFDVRSDDPSSEPQDYTLSFIARKPHPSRGAPKTPKTPKTPKPTKTPTPKPTKTPTPKPTKTATPTPTPEPEPKTAPDGRPWFYLPFKCGQRWKATTYAGHNPETGKIDFFWADGESRGQPVLASASGKVVWVNPDLGMVEIDHGGGWYTAYIHMDPPQVDIGDQVDRGQQIGLVGSRDTGVAHLHYEQIYDEDGSGFGDTYPNSPEIRIPIIQGKEYALTAEDDPIIESKNC